MCTSSAAKKVGWAEDDGSGLVSCYLGKVKADSTGVGCATLEVLTPHDTPAGAGKGGAGTDLSL